MKLAAEFLDSMPYNERYPLHYAIYILDMEQAPACALQSPPQHPPSPHLIPRSWPQVKDLLTEYSTINERDSSYWTPLHIACLIGGKGEKETRAQVPATPVLVSNEWKARG